MLMGAGLAVAVGGGVAFLEKLANKSENMKPNNQMRNNK